MSRIFNFSPGPATLPEPVLQQAREAVWELGDTGVGILETSHRSAAFDEIIAAAEERLHRLMGLDDDQLVLFLHGGASTQFFQIPMNLLRGGRATYLDTGTWSAKAITEARRFGSVDVPFSSKESRYDHVPSPVQVGALPEGTAYLHYTSNNTVAGTQYHWVPEVGGEAFLACDASSDFLCRPMDGSRYGIVYGGAQKNLGPSGMAVVGFRRSLLERCAEDLPTMVDYRTHVKKGSRFNTPNTFAIYVVERVAAWIEETGGLEAMGRRNERKAGRIYDTIDGSDFWQGKARPASRSWMNVTFATPSEELDKEFVSTAAAQGLSGLKGHRSVGGLRASIYNAMPEAGVDALVEFMKHFEKTRG